MTLEQARPVNRLNPSRKGPAIIAHQGGNTRSQILDALAHLADQMEVDLWVEDGRFEARHDRSLRPLPVLWGGMWRFKWAPKHPFGLAELLRDTAGEIGIFLDLKNGGTTAGRLVRRAIDEAGFVPQVSASSQLWSVLRGIAAAAPEVDLYYSIDSVPKLDLFMSVSERDLRPRGVSCKHKFITAPLVRKLHERGLLVIAWTVDDGDRAMQLAEMGVDGITTNVVPRIRDRFSALQV
ncbi:MAG TPA: glycerophosphodiester phosphodiesterase [Tepidiformaceae bacterium]|nr:glycerophosphodiester phosphodiesterase [Tepidiformaceae bacterium]